MIYTITVNPCLDIMRFLQHTGTHGLQDGTYRPEDPNNDERQRPGGKGIDVSRALVCLRNETKALGFIGDATGKILLGLLDAEGIESDFVDGGVETRTNIIIFLRDESGMVVSEIRINSKGKEVPPNRYSLLYQKCAEIDDADGLAVSGSLCFEMQDTFYNALIRNIRKNNPKCVVVLDGPDRATAEAMSLDAHRPDFIKPNLGEFDALLRHVTNGATTLCNEYPEGVSRDQYLEYIYSGAAVKPPPDGKFSIDRKSLSNNWRALMEHLRFIKKTFGVQTLLSLGPLGCCTVAEKEDEFLHAYMPEPCKLRTRVGAGDCVVAGFLSHYVEGRDLDLALKAAVAAASARVEVEESRVGKYLDRDRFSTMLKSVRLNKYTEQDFEKPKYLECVDPSLLAQLAGKGNSRDKSPEDKESKDPCPNAQAK